MLLLLVVLLSSFAPILVNTVEASQQLNCASYGALNDDPTITANLLQISRRAVDVQYNDDNGFIYDDEGREEVRDTAYAALLYLELGEIGRAEKSLNAVIDAQITDENDPGFGGMNIRDIYHEYYLKSIVLVCIIRLKFEFHYSIKRSLQLPFRWIGEAAFLRLTD